MAEESPLNGRSAGSGPTLIPQGHHLGKPPVPLNRPATLIGSRHNAHLHLLSRQVSKAHALVINDGGQLYIRDLQSRTHTYVNGEPVTEADLKPGDVIDVGSFRFRVSAKARVRQKDAPAAPPAALHVNGGEMPIPLEQRVILIGRRPSCDISLIEESASTAHAVIYEYQGKRMIRDLGSRTGTFVNGRRVSHQPLEFADQIRIGETDMRYMPAEEPAGEMDELENLVGTAPLGGEVIDQGILESERAEPELQDEPVPPAEPPVKKAEAAIPVAEPPSQEAPASIDLQSDPDVGDSHDTVSIPLSDIREEQRKPKLSDQVTEDEVDPPQVLVSRELHEEKLSSSATHPDLQKAAEEALERAGDTADEPAVEDEPEPEVQEEAESPVEPEEKPIPVAELDRVDFGGLKLDLPEPEVSLPGGVDLADELNEPSAVDETVAPLDFSVEVPPIAPMTEVSERPLIAMDELPDVAPPPVSESTKPPVPVSVTPTRKRRGSKRNVPPEVVEKTEPTPESAQGLEGVIQGTTGVEPAMAEISDSQLDSVIEQFSGSGNDPVVEAPEKDVEEAISVEDLLKPVSEEEVPPLELSVDEPPATPVVPVVEEVSEPLQLEAPAEESKPATPVKEERAVAEKTEPVEPPEATKKPPVVEPVKTVGISPPVAPEQAESFGYLGGMPLQLKESGDEAPAQTAGADEPEAEVPLEHPPLVRPQGMVMPPRPKVKPSAFARQRVQMPAEETPVFEDVEIPPFAGAEPASRGQMATAFDGLAMPPVREIDVFSQMPAPAADDPVFGAGGHDTRQPHATAEAAEPAADDEQAAAQTQPPRDPFGSVPVAATVPPGSQAADGRRRGVPEIPPARKRRWSVPVLVILMLLSAAAAAGGAWFMMPRQARVEAAVAFKNLSTEQSRQQVDRQLQTILQEPEVRASARAIYLARAGSDAVAGFLDDSMDYARMLSDAKWSGTDSSVWVIGRMSAQTRADESRLTALMASLYADDRIANRRMAYEKVQQQLRELNAAIDQSQHIVEQRTAEIAELERRLHGRRTMDDLAPLEKETAAAEKAWHEAAERTVQLKGELEQIRQSPATEPSAQSAVAATLENDQELRNMRASLDDLKMRLERVRATSHSQADEARQKLDQAAQRLQQQIASVQQQMRDNPELQNYVAAVRDLQNAVQELTADFVQSQKELTDRIAGLKRLLDEKMQARQSRIWENDKELQDLNEQLALTERQYNAALSGGDETAAQADKLKSDVDRLREQIRRRRELLGDDSVYAEAINQLQQIIDASQKQLADSRKRAEEMIQRVQRSVLAAQPPAQRLPAEQQALAVELEKRLEELNAARREYADAVQNGQESEPAKVIAEDIATLQNRIDERTRQLTAARNQQAGEQDELARLQAMERKRAQLAEAQQAESTAREAYFEKSKLLQSTKENIDRRLASITQKDQAAQELKARRDRLDTLMAQSRETAYPEPATVTIAGLGPDMRPTYAAGAAGVVVLLFAIFIVAAARAPKGQGTMPAKMAEELPAESGEGIIRVPA